MGTLVSYQKTGVRRRETKVEGSEVRRQKTGIGDGWMSSCGMDGWMTVFGDGYKVRLLCWYI
jgi:hypothetical protein